MSETPKFCGCVITNYPPESQKCKYATLSPERWGFTCTHKCVIAATEKLCKEIAGHKKANEELEDKVRELKKIILESKLTIRKSELTTENDLLSISTRVNNTMVRIYNLIRSVGRGELTADNALHQLIEDYHDLRLVCKGIDTLAKKGGVK
ncbi:MAG: hypothetical protein J6V72_19935 [Kiritimatiellae bacterium]|nr:hypothetical protein [Kiritimatiellia bacterium]